MPGPRPRSDRTACSCSISCLQPMAASTLSARPTHLRAAARTRAGTKVFPNAAASTLRSCSSSCHVLVSCFVPTAVTRRLRVRTSVANGRGGETKCSRPCDTETRTCCRIRASPVVYPEDLSQEETVEPEIQGGVPQTYRSRRLDCQFWLASYAVDKAKAAATGVSLMDLASQEQGSALPDCHKRLSQSSEQRCGPSLE